MRVRLVLSEGWEMYVEMEMPYLQPKYEVFLPREKQSIFNCPPGAGTIQTRLLSLQEYRWPGGFREPFYSDSDDFKPSPHQCQWQERVDNSNKFLKRTIECLKDCFPNNVETLKEMFEVIAEAEKYLTTCSLPHK